MHPVISACVMCCDEHEEVVYKCNGNGGTCPSQLCAGCVKLSFDDECVANNASFCTHCNYPCALDMIAAVCGDKGPIIASEHEREAFLKKEESRYRVASRVL